MEQLGVPVLAYILRGGLMNFPRLKDTSFPNLENVDVYQFANTFDYTRWNEKTKVKLVNVLWNSDYSDVVKFDSDSARDSYFDNIRDNYTVELLQAARIVPEAYVKLPIPYDVMARYNYLFIDMPIATSENTPLDYETPDGLRRWYFFIDDVKYLSPNSTQVFLTLDVWTNFINDVEINYMMLERGHAGVYASSTDLYLSSPLHNSQWLLAPDVNFDKPNITRSADFVPFGNGAKYVCIASTCAYNQIPSLGEVTVDSDYDSFGTITYSDIDVRYGHQLQVNGLTIGNGLDFSNAKTCAFPGVTADDKIPNNLSVYAIAAEEVYGINATFYQDVIEKCPQFLNTVKACFVVDINCIQLSTAVTIAGHTLNLCVGHDWDLFSKELTKQDFGYPVEYERFAKLYTSPYAVMEVTDNAGASYEFKIEETSRLRAKAVTSVAFPFLNYRVFFDGICGEGSTSYSWRDLKGNESTLNMYRSDWFKYCFDWDIPTFALFMDGETAYQLESFNRNTQQGINNALVAYHTHMRTANTANKNECDSADTARTNVQNSTGTAHQNAYNSANANQTNSNNNADTAKSNTDDAADTTRTNVDNTCANLRTNTNLGIANIVANEEAGLSAGQAIKNIQNGLNTDNLNATNLAASQTVSQQNETTIATTDNNVGGQMISGVVSQAQAGVGLGMAVGGAMAAGAATGAAAGSVAGGVGALPGAGIGALVGIGIGLAGGTISGSIQQANAKLVTQASQATLDATTNCNTTQTNAVNQAADDKYDSEVIQRRFVYQHNNNLLDTQTNNSIATDKTNADNVKTTTKNNAQRAHDTAYTNAQNSYNAATTNADNTQTTDRTNADNTQNVVKNNSGYTRDVAELNAKEQLENSARNAQAAINDARNNQPRAIGEAAGNPAPDAMRTRGVQIKVKTQSYSAIRQTGDVFARYGYAINQVWDVSRTGLKLMRHFTYWKAADIWVDDKKASTNIIQKAITNMFDVGVTVWNNPDEIGRVNIYDN